MDAANKAPAAAGVPPARAETGPSDFVLKVVFPYVEWKELIKNGELVSRRWRNCLFDDDVWRPICDLKIKRDEVVLRNQIANNLALEERDYLSPTHEILATQMNKRSGAGAGAGAGAGRSYREMFILSKRVGDCLLEHQLEGPDASRSDHGDTRSLREICTHDYQWIVGPTIETLRRVFDDPNKHERHHLVAEMKGRLLNHAREEPVLMRIEPPQMEKEDLATSAGKYMLAAASTTSNLDGDAFIPSSPIKLSVGEMLEGIKTIAGKDVATTLDLQVKVTSEGYEKKCIYQEPALKRARHSLNELEFPTNPVDSLCFLIHKHWPDRYQDIDKDVHRTEEAQQHAFQKVIEQWWDGLGEPIRNLFLTIYRDLSPRTDDLDPLPENARGDDPSSIPPEALSFLVDARYFFVRRKAADTFWSDLQPSLRDAILKMYKQHADNFRGAIMQEYHTVYAGRNQELNAKVLLDIFLEVIPNTRYIHAPTMTSDYCNDLPDTMVNAMEEWDRLAHLAKTDDTVLWDPQTLSDLESFEAKFVSTQWQRIKKPSYDFCTSTMVERFLYQMLSSDAHIPEYYAMKRAAEKLAKDIREMMCNDDGTSRQMPPDQWAVFLQDTQKVLHDYRSFSTYLHTREHAMMALIPLLPHLSKFDSKRLIYALFIQRKGKGGSYGFAKGNLNFDDFFARGIPCPKNNVETDTTDMIRWANAYDVSQICHHGVLARLLGLPLPVNIISAMADFLLDQLYQQSLYDVDLTKYRNAVRVLPYMIRFCYESPASAHIVWDCLEQAIENTTTVVRDLDADDIAGGERETFSLLAFKLTDSCIHTRAKKVIPAIRRLYETQLAADNRPHINLEDLIQRINEAPPVFADSQAYYSLHHGEQI